MDHLFQIRVTGILLEDERMLLVKQNVTSSRHWSLPGGRVERGETLEAAIVREIEEETGLSVKVSRLLYVCDKPDSAPPLIHITFLLQRIGGSIRLPSNEYDHNPIHDVAMVPVQDLTAYGFTEKFMKLVQDGFPETGSYQGLKSSIGL